MEKPTITNFYIPKSGKVWSIQFEDLRMENNDNEITEPISYRDNIQIDGLMNINCKSNAYVQMIDILEIPSLDPTDVLDKLSEHCNIKARKEPPVDWNSLRLVLRNDEDVETKAMVLFEAFVRKSPIESIQRKYLLSTKSVKNIISNFKKNIRMIKIENRRTLNKQSKLKDRHIEYIKQFWDHNTGRYYTLSTIKLNLLKEFPDLGNIWLSTISKWLKAKLNMSFKKWNKINFKMQHPENIQLILESMMFQIYLEKKDYKIIFVDEF